MNGIRETLDRPEPTMAVLVTGGADAELINEINRTADVAEFRADLFETKTVPRLTYELSRLTLPKLLTIRRLGERGEWRGSEQNREDLFRGLLPYVDAVDLELGSSMLDDIDGMPSVDKEARDRGRAVIISHHDFEGTPESGELDDIINLAVDKGADYIKIATFVNSEDDYSRLRNALIRHREERAGLIVVGMGEGMGAELAKRSRIEFPGYGSKMTYASDGTGYAAPGQMDFRETAMLLAEEYPDYSDLLQSD